MPPDAIPPGAASADAVTVAGVPAWAVSAIVEAGARMHACGWVPATAGNISVRLDDGRIAITRSGVHKAFLDAEGVMLVDAAGTSQTAGARPSAETLLHCQIYRLFAAAGAVVHGHSVAATVLSMARPGPIVLAGYEMLKVFEGCRTHEVPLEIPVFDNDQDIARLCGVAEPRLAAMLGGTASRPLCYVIRGHGCYAWGPDLDTALARLEGLEFLLACELAKGTLR
ncbi:MAG: methylthioribulose 1-phosphate dehydratase [Rhodospirillales bacterium]|nr:methylthioribulose 1-phosphate dehydratase [Rhodospirillales bacterium]